MTVFFFLFITLLTLYMLSVYIKGLMHFLRIFRDSFLFFTVSFILIKNSDYELKQILLSLL